MTGDPGDPSRIDDQNGLTPIPRRIHCAATDEDLDSGNELDQIAIDQFLDTLSEVALAIIQRWLQEGQ